MREREDILKTAVLRRGHVTERNSVDGSDRERWCVVTVVTRGPEGGHTDGGHYLLADLSAFTDRHPAAHFGRVML